MRGLTLRLQDNGDPTNPCCLVRVRRALWSVAPADIQRTRKLFCKGFACMVEKAAAEPLMH